MSLSKKCIEEALNLPSYSQFKTFSGADEESDLYADEESTEVEAPELNLEEAKAAMQKLKAMRVQLRELPDITSRKMQLDRLASLAEEKFNDIFDRAFNCEDRFASEMINAATAMLKMAIDAHSKVIDSDVKLIDLQIKKDKIEIELNQKQNGFIPRSDENTSTDDDAVLYSRNAVLSRKDTDK